jgi:pimeloyl-ACP methyl ester carboxylesterase
MPDTNDQTKLAKRSLTVEVDGLGDVAVNFGDTGAGPVFLLLHGGAGPLSVAGFGVKLAARLGARVLTPTHPGFDGTTRPAELTTIGQLAAVYAAMLEKLELTGVTIVGNSIGGWIAAELAVQGSPRVERLVIVDGVGIEVPGHPIADFFSLTFPELAKLSYHDPERFRIDPDALPPAAQEAMRGNRQTLAVYAGEAMADETLRGRLSAIGVPTLVVWGDSDGIADPEYGRAYADAIPGAQFKLIANTGHMPQIENPEGLLELLAGQLKG